MYLDTIYTAQQAALYACKTVLKEPITQSARYALYVHLIAYHAIVLTAFHALLIRLCIMVIVLMHAQMDTIKAILNAISAIQLATLAACKVVIV